MLLLAPMEGMLDHTLRDILTRVGGIDRCVSEFIRISGTLLPERAFLRIVPELRHGGRTRSGVPVRAQLLGSDPVSLAENAARLATLGPHGIDLNFGCPAKIVNRHGGGATLLDDPERVAANFRAWLAQQAASGKAFTPEQQHWLEMIRDHIAASLGLEIDDFDLPPFSQQGGLGRVHQLFGAELPRVIEELNRELVA